MTQLQFRCCEAQCKIQSAVCRAITFCPHPTQISDSMFANRDQDRRLFLKAAAASAAIATTNQLAAQDTKQEKESPAEKIVVGIMGCNGRGGAISKGMMARPNTEIGFICDVDTRASDRVASYAEKTQGKRPKVTTDFRKVLDDSDIDVLVCAAPNHWHAPATILGCAAGKHVYVEKPCSHTPAEGEMAVAAARKHNRVVQMGTQRRTWPGIVEAVKKIHDGEIGQAIYARSWYNNRRGTIGKGKQVQVPDWLDWDLWQGPSTRRPFKDNVVHYNWHWHWHWGNGELGNNGVHGLDVARWALQVDFPKRVTVGGGHYRHEDDQETPDTLMVTYDFPGKKTITWEGLSWSPQGSHDSGFGISIHGTNGAIVIKGNGYTQFNDARKEVASGNGAVGDSDHFQNFLDCVRSGNRPNADIELAHQSTLLCHLGNIAYRTEGLLNTDPKNGHILGQEKAQQMWTKEYAAGWEPKV